MSQKYCMHCGKEITDTTFCPGCGRPVSTQTSVEKAPPTVRKITQQPTTTFSTKALAIAMIMLLVGLAAGVGLWYFQPRTVTVTETIAGPTVTVTLTPTPQKSDVQGYVLTMVDILSEFQDIFSESRDKAVAYGNGEIDKSQFLGYIREAKNDLQDLYETASKQNPPKELGEAHLHLLRSLDFAYAAYTLLEDGVMQEDVSLVEESADFLTLSTDELNAASTQIEASK